MSFDKSLSSSFSLQTAILNSIFLHHTITSRPEDTNYPNDGITLTHDVATWLLRSSFGSQCITTVMHKKQIILDFSNIERLLLTITCLRGRSVRQRSANNCWTSRSNTDDINIVSKKMCTVLSNYNVRNIFNAKSV